MYAPDGLLLINFNNLSRMHLFDEGLGLPHFEKKKRRIYEANYYLGGKENDLDGCRRTS
jgi:hypothetical protein